MEMGKRHVVSKNAVINWGYHIFRIRCKINPCFVCVIELKGSNMVKKIMRDPLFLAQKSVDATEADKQVITDLLDTLRANLDHCVGMAANMIGVKKNIIVVASGPFQFAMVNPVITKKTGAYRRGMSVARRDTPMYEISGDRSRLPRPAFQEAAWEIFRLGGADYPA